jgi:hypothetical protein
LGSGGHGANVTKSGLVASAVGMTRSAAGEVGQRTIMRALEDAVLLRSVDVLKGILPRRVLIAAGILYQAEAAGSARISRVNNSHAAVRSALPDSRPPVLATVGRGGRLIPEMNSPQVAVAVEH